MTEDELETAVTQLCAVLHLHTAHFRPAMTRPGRWVTPVAGQGKGWPDWTIVGPGGILFRELKSETGKPSPEQVVWLEKLRAAGGDADVWRPADWRSGRVQDELLACAGRQVKP